RAVHVLRHLRGGLSLRRPVLEPGVRVLGGEHRRVAPRQGAAGRLDEDGARAPGPGGGGGGQEGRQELRDDTSQCPACSPPPTSTSPRTSPSGSWPRPWPWAPSGW